MDMRPQYIDETPVDERIDRAWWILFGAGLCMFCSEPAVIQFTYGTFVSQIARSATWSPLVIAAAIGPAMLPTFLLAPLVGLAADRFGVRQMALIGGPLFGAGLVMLGLLPRSAGQFAFYLTLACGAGFAATPILYAHLITGWFVKQRGLALSIVMGCSSLGVAFWSPLAAFVMPHGWRTAYVLLGIASGATIFLSAVFFIRNAPRRAVAATGGFAPGATLLEALRSLTFWRIAIIFILLTTVLSGLAVNLPVMLRHIGLSPQQAASIMTVVGLAMFLGMTSAGLFFDRWFAPYVTAIYAVMPASALILLQFDQSVATFFFAGAMIGAGLGSELNAAAFIISRAFGIRAFGAIYGVLTLAFGVTGAFGPALVGAALVRTSDLRIVFGIELALLIPAIFLLFTMRNHHLPYGAPVAGADL